MAGARRRWLARIAMILGGFLAAGLIAEGYVRVRGLGWRTINRSLYWQTSDLAAYRYSDDPFLHYEMNPGARVEGTGPWGNRFVISVDEYGARGPVHDEASGDVFRVLVFGGSTIFGAGVDDGETLPAVLEQRLADPGTVGVADGRYEVWNFGNSGYVAAQALRLARNTLARVDGVDLVVIVPTNNGRRPFLGGEDALDRDHRWFFWHDPSAYLENFPPPPKVPAGLHRSALRYSAVYRYVIATKRTRMPNNPPDQGHISAINREEVKALRSEAEEAGAELVFAYYPRRKRAGAPNLGFFVPKDEFVDLQREGQPDDFYEIHPPPATLAIHAANLAQELVAAGYLPAATAVDPEPAAPVDPEPVTPVDTESATPVDLVPTAPLDPDQSTPVDPEPATTVDPKP